MPVPGTVSLYLSALSLQDPSAKGRHSGPGEEPVELESAVTEKNTQVRAEGRSWGPGLEKAANTFKCKQ